MIHTIASLDIGTTAVKALLIDITGKELAIAEQTIPFQTPQPGWFEQKPEQFLQACIKVLHTIAQTDPNMKILAIALACLGSSLIPAQSDGTPIYPMITWMDKRSDKIVRRIRQEGLESKIRSITGWWLDPGLPLSMIIWLKENRPEIFKKTERWLSLNDYIAFHLTGQFCTNPSCGAAMQLFNIQTGDWSGRILDLAGIRREQLSPIKPSSDVIGYLTPQMSKNTGIKPDVPVINGGQDHSSEAIVLGMSSAGDTWLGTGTSWVINGIMEESAIEKVPAKMNLNYHTLPQRWTISQLLGGIGASLEWWLGLSWEEACLKIKATRSEMFLAFNEEVAHSPPGSKDLLFVPLTGTSQLTNNTICGGFSGLRLDHTHADMNRAILEGAGFELLWALDSIRKAGMAVEHLWLIGGAARSPVWPTILCNITGIPISTTQYKHGPALGVAILAGVKVGSYKNIRDGRAHFNISTCHLDPDIGLTKIYSERYHAYQRTAEMLKAVTDNR